MKVKKQVCLAMLAIAVAFAGSVSADSYFVVGGKWGKHQNKAIAEHGGTVTWSHAATGIALVESNDTNFLELLESDRTFQYAGRNRVVQFQQPSRTVHADDIDPSTETFYDLQWHLPAIDADDAWAAGCTGSGVRVAVLDGGIYDTHADLAPNFDASVSTSFVDGFAYNEELGTFWHGTHVAGIVAAAGNDFGVLGVAPEATIIGVKVLHGGSGEFGAIFQGIAHAVDVAGADIINMSLGANFPKNDAGAGRFMAALNKIVNYASSNGVLVVSSAGNGGLNWDQSFNFIKVPAEAGNGIAVSATGPTGFAYGGTDFDSPASYTDHGHSLVHVAAPGGDFRLFPNGLWFYDMVLSTCRGTVDPPSFSFCFSAGTSMAAPAASGVAALIKSNYPGMSVGELKSALANTAIDLGKPGHDIFYGRGWVNALNACNYVPEEEL